MPEVKKFACALGKTKLKVFAQGDALLLKSIEVEPDANASQLLMRCMIASEKMQTLSQISPILKTLVANGLLTTKEVSSDVTGRPMVIYRLTRKGSAILASIESILETVQRKT